MGGVTFSNLGRLVLLQAHLQEAGKGRETLSLLIDEYTRSPEIRRQALEPAIASLIQEGQEKRVTLFSDPADVTAALEERLGTEEERNPFYIMPNFVDALEAGASEAIGYSRISSRKMRLSPETPGPKSALQRLLDKYGGAMISRGGSRATTALNARLPVTEKEAIEKLAVAEGMHLTLFLRLALYLLRDVITSEDQRTEIPVREVTVVTESGEVFEIKLSLRKVPAD